MTMKSDLQSKLSSLSPAKRALLEKKLREQNKTLPAERKKGIGKRPEGAIPLSFAQQRIWFLEQLEPGSPTYNDHFAFRLQGMLDATLLERSLQTLIQRHEALRTTFAVRDGEATQVILSELHLPLTVVDLRDREPEPREVDVHRICYQEAQRPFDLLTGPLLRATLLQVGDTEHVLVLTIHHIITDGWSLGVLVRELAAHYTALAGGGKGQSAALEELSVQYAEYAHWQRTTLSDHVLENKLAYWKKQLGGGLPVLELPTDYPRPALQTFHGATRTFELGRDVSRRLEELSKQEGVTLFMTLLTAYKILLHRYTGEEDILVGTPIAGRHDEETEKLIGVFVNTLVLRSRLDSGKTFRQLLQEVRQTTLDAYDHQDMPFEKLVESLQPERNLSQSPLFQVMFIQQGDPLAGVEWPGIGVEYMTVEKGTAKFDLTLAMVPTANGWMGQWEYNTDLFAAETIERMAGHYLTLLEGIMRDPDHAIAQLPLLTAAEQKQLLIEWNNTARGYEAEFTIPQLFEAQVERTPNEVALVFDAYQLTYQELNERANQLAHRLKRMGVTPDARVGICMERSAEMMIGLLAIHKAGGAYVPLDPAYPADRLQFMVEDAQIGVLLTQSHLTDLFPQADAQVLCYDTAAEEIRTESTDHLESELTPDHLAYVIYTSGSTGQPKGVEITQRNVVNFFAGMDARIGCGEQDAMLAVTSIGFDISVLELFWTLTRGCKVVLLSKQETIESVVQTATPSAADENDYSLRTQMHRHGVTMMQCTPSLMKMLLENEAAVEALRALRVLLLGGEALPTSLARRLRETLPTRLVNMYGPTEATVWATTHEVLDVQGSVPIGRPIANYEVYVLDRHLQPVPIGVPGELHIGGIGLARGYLNRPDLTAEKFIHNPFASPLADHLYKTGDLVRWLSDGTLDYLDRLDHQVKIRGFRVELDEIARVIEQHALVREAVVIAREEVPGDKYLAAYLVVAAEERADEEIITDLRSFLTGRLPEHMVPSAFVVLDALPLTPNGKVNRRALPTPERTGGKTTAYIAPHGELEETIAAIWAEILHVERVGAQDHFFTIGGHSLLGTKVISRMNSLLGVNLQLRVLFETPILAELARTVEAMRQEPVSAAQTEQPVLTRMSRTNNRAKRPNY